MSPYIFPIRPDEDVHVENEVNLRPRSYSDCNGFNSKPKPSVLCNGCSQLGQVNFDVSLIDQQVKEEINKTSSPQIAPINKLDAVNINQPKHNLEQNPFFLKQSLKINQDSESMKFSILSGQEFNELKGSPNEKQLISPELSICTPETAMRDAGIRKFVNPYTKKSPAMEPV